MRSIASTLVGLLLLMSAPSVVVASNATRDPELVAQLRAAATQLDRLDLLPNDSDWLFDFNAQDYYSTFSPGGIVSANIATFPAVVGNGMTMAMLNLGPCSMLPPHYHPRAAKYAVSIHGTIGTYMIEENTARVVTQTLTPGQMTIFPRASLHTMFNLGCDNAQLVSALSSEDPGTQNIAGALFELPNPDLIDAAFGYVGVDTNATRNSIPGVGTGSNYGIASCLARCKVVNGGVAPNGTYGAPYTKSLDYDAGIPTVAPTGYGGRK